MDGLRRRSLSLSPFVLVLMGCGMAFGQGYDVAWTFGNVGASSFRLDAFDPADANLAPLGSKDPTLPLVLGNRYQVRITNYTIHPFEVIAKGTSASKDIVLLSAAVAGPFEADPDVAWEEAGQGVVRFTLTPSLYQAMIEEGHGPGYRCAVHFSSMRGNFTVSGDDPDRRDAPLQTPGVAKAGVARAGVVRAMDVNPDPNIVEIYLEAKPVLHEFARGKPADAWAYNGSIPGPLIEGKGGDTLIVHFTNNLPEPTTIHWHGLELPATMDGSMISQDAVEPDGGQFRYEFKLLAPALYWYHPHIQGSEQVEKGLYGLLLIRGGDETLLDLPEDEQILALDDVLVDEAGQVAPAYPDDPLPRTEMQLNGREGNVLLVNGENLPTLEVKTGWPVRWRIVNTANARFFRLHIPDHVFYRIGGDSGLLENPVRLSPDDLVLQPDHHLLLDLTAPQIGLMLAPAERADVVFTPHGNPGEELTVYWVDFPRGRHTAFYHDDGTIGFGPAQDDGQREAVPLLRLRLIDNGPWERGREYTPPSHLRTIDALEPDAGLDRLTIRFGHAPPDLYGNVLFFAAVKAVDAEMAGLPFYAVTPAEALHAQVGQTRLLEIVNTTGGIHPYHLHGFFFQPFEIEYVDLDNPQNNQVVPLLHRENKDTVQVPARPGAPGRSASILRALVRFDDTGREGQIAAFGKIPTEEMSGGWLAHCHILEHADLGMMTFLELTYPTEREGRAADKFLDRDSPVRTGP